MAKKKAKKKKKVDGIAITLHGDTVSSGSWVPVLEVSDIGVDERVVFELLWPDDDDKKCDHVKSAGKKGPPVPGFYVLKFDTKEKLLPCKFRFPDWKKAPKGELLTCMIVRGSGVETRVFPIVKRS